MFDTIRKHQRVLQFLLLLLIFPAFVFFGVSGYQGMMSDDAVATVNGSKLSRQEFDEGMRRQLEQLKRVLGEQVDAKLLDSPAARAEVLESLIAQRALALEAQTRHISVTDELLRKTILQIPGLRKPDGSFDAERYKALLSAQALTEPVFENQLRRDLSVQALPDAAGGSALLPRTLLDRLIVTQEQVRDVRELEFKTDAYRGKVSPSDADLKKYYEENGGAFETPESAKVEYLVLSAEALAAQVVLGADDVRSYYEQNSARYGTPEQRKASHILIKLEPGANDEQRKAARSKAEELLKQLKSGGDFAALAKANSADAGSAAAGGDLGAFTRDTMVKPFADAAFALKEGALSELVETEFGLHIIKLTGITAGAVRPFEQVKPEIEAELRAQLAGRKFAEAAETFSNLVYEQSDSLKPAADKLGLTVQTFDGLTRAGADKLPPKSPLASRKLLDAVFSPDSLKTKRNTEAIEAGGNTLVSARIVEYRPAQRKPFDTVAAQVRARVIDAGARKLAAEAGQARLKELEASPSTQGFGGTRKVARAAAPQIPPSAVDAVFRKQVDKLPAFVGVDLGEDGYAIYVVERVTDPGPEQVAARRAQYQQQILQLYGQQDTADLIESLKARSKVVRHTDRIATRSESR